MEYDVDAANDKYAPFTPEERAECKALAEKHYWRFNSIKFKPTGLVVISEDQGGWPGEALKLEIYAEPEVVRRACLAAMRAL